MWGNLRGWIISGVMLVLVGLLVWSKGTIGGPSSPTGKWPVGLASAALPIDPASLGVAGGSNDCDSADLYHQAIEEVKAHERQYEKSKGQTVMMAKDPPLAVKLVLQAADCAKGTPFVKKPQDVINYNNRQYDLEALNTAGTITGQIGFYFVTKQQPQEAEPYLRATFLLGKRMYDERLRFEEYTDGLNLMESATSSWARAARSGPAANKARADQFDQFGVAVVDQRSKILPVWQIVSGIGEEGRMLSYPGDMFDMAEHGKDPMWRIEALLKLGRMYYMANVQPEDQFGARQVLTTIAQEPDLSPGVKAAAVAARDLPVEKFRMFGG